jgi:hypothetical protein
MSNVDGSLFKIAENSSDLNSLNLIESDYKIIEDNLENFNNVKLNLKNIIKYVDNAIIYQDTINILNRDGLISDISNVKKNIEAFKINNQNNPLFSRIDNYYNLLTSLDVNTIIPIDVNTGKQILLNKSLEKYLYDLNNDVINPLQIP